VARLLNRRPGRASALVLGVLPLALLALAYLIGSDARLAANPNDKLLPSLATLVDTTARLATQPDARSGSVLLWTDTAASLQRLAWGVGVSAALGFAVGVAMGLIPLVRATLGPLVAVLSMIPPLALLPILFIVLGLGELSKIVLIGFGVAPFLMRDLAQRAGEIPREQLIKAQTLGASTWQIALRVVIPQTLPGLIHGLRLTRRPRLAVPDRRRGHCGHGRSGLPHLPGAAVSGHGRDPAVRGMDHAAGLRDGPRAGSARPALVSVA